MRGKPYFISRPRRFGKSLTVSALESIFLGRRELFKGLWIDQSDWEWVSYPVIRLDMGKVNSSTPELFVQTLTDLLCKIGDQYSVKLPTDLPLSSLFDTLILKLSELGKVAVLVDEYDKPLIDQVKDTELANQIREQLRKFYEIIKANDGNIKFIFLTGVTKFAKVSIFSGLNNLNDITLSNDYSGMIGYTKDELDQYFSKEVKELAASNNISVDACNQQVKDWYNGYRFSEEGTQVYNPFSVLKLLSDKEFRPHWFSTGTPTFLLDLIKQGEFDLLELEQLEVSMSSIESFELDNIPILPLLYQTGYLTIKEFNPRFRTYLLSYPNHEVREAFTESLISYFTTKQSATENFLSQLYYNLDAELWDHKAFFDLIKNIMALVPYDLYIKKEAYYHTLFYLIITLAGLKIGAEVHTQRGRADAVLITDKKIIVFEIKLNKTAKAAMDQIKEKKYYEMYSDKKLPIYLVGMNFNREIRTIDDFKIDVIQNKL
jgi:hypothetical protein